MIAGWAKDAVCACAAAWPACAPATRVDYNFSDKWAIAAEEYDDFGQLRHFDRASQQTHQLFAVIDYNGKPINVEGGIGFGLTSATDRLTLKLILSRDLN